MLSHTLTQTITTCRPPSFTLAISRPAPSAQPCPHPHPHPHPHPITPHDTTPPLPPTLPPFTNPTPRSLLPFTITPRLPAPLRAEVGWMGGWVDGWMGGWMDRWMDEWMGGFIVEHRAFLPAEGLNTSRRSWCSGMDGLTEEMEEVEM